MYKDQEVLSFLVTFGKCKSIDVLEKLEHFDKAPYGMKEDTPQKELNRILFRFFNARCIAQTRCDYEKIIKATNCKDSFELSFKAHGLSLSNHFWFKKEDEDLSYNDINFFTNKWDDSFARAVLKGDYESLSNVSLNVPDIVTAGWAVKGWLCEEKPTLYKLGIAEGQSEESISEVLACRLAKRLFNEDEVVEYKLEQINGRYASKCQTIIGVDEELVPLSVIIPSNLYKMYTQQVTDRKYSKQFFEEIAKIGLPGIYQFFVKVMCLKNLCFVNDLHFDNISVIRNISTGEIRIAPLIDLGGAYGSGKTGREFLAKLNKASFFILYYVYGNFDPEWDYSWFDPTRLEGFEDEIREYLSKSDFYNPELIELIIEFYQGQIKSLIAAKTKANK